MSALLFGPPLARVLSDVQKREIVRRVEEEIGIVEFEKANRRIEEINDQLQDILFDIMTPGQRAWYTKRTLRARWHVFARAPRWMKVLWSLLNGEGFWQ